MAVIAFDEMSTWVTALDTFKSPAFTAVIAFELKLTLISCSNCASPTGIRVNLFPLKFNASTGVVGRIFFTIASMSSVDSPLPEQSIVSVELLLVVG